VLEGLRIVELASDRAAYAGKLLADLGADVVVVEPPGGHPTRSYGPFADDKPDPERSLWWWYYNTSKRAVVLDLGAPNGAAAFAELVASADVILEGEDPGTLERLGIDHPRFRATRPQLIWVSVTPFGRQCADLDAPMTDLTLLAGGGLVWNCGYDDHSIPPVRGGGGQAQHMASVFAAMGTLTAVLHRDETGAGQHVDVSMHAAANVTTESGTFVWLVAGQTIQRQTGRHAATVPTMETQVLAADGRYVTTGFPPHDAKDYQAILDWLRELGLEEEFPEAFFLQMGVDRGGVDARDLGSDAEAAEIFGSGRSALCFIASRLPAYDFFVGTQERDIQCGIVYAPEEALEDEHFRARGFQVPVRHPELDRDIIYPGAPFSGSSGGWRISRRPPLVGEHDEEILGASLSTPDR
jgi:crotonobetainyl-CoA:carnitine CoA-transferase CaiB-like acyl-CoA transferase